MNRTQQKDYFANDLIRNFKSNFSSTARIATALLALKAISPGPRICSGGSASPLLTGLLARPPARSEMSAGRAPWSVDRLG
jgi:hypothetical protein